MPLACFKNLPDFQTSERKEKRGNERQTERKTRKGDVRGREANNFTRQDKLKREQGEIKGEMEGKRVRQTVRWLSTSSRNPAGSSLISLVSSSPRSLN